MLFTISGKHIEITEGIRKHAEQKTSKLPKYYNGINQVEVIIGSSPSGKGPQKREKGLGNPNTSVEIIARGEHSKIFIVTETGEDAYKCIDIAVHKLERQLRRKKTKERDNKHGGGD